MRQLLLAGLALVAAYSYWRGSGSEPAAPAAPAAAAAPRAPGAAPAAPAERGAKEVAPAPAADDQAVYGVAYDLATGRPVGGAEILIGDARARTDERGRYRMFFPSGALAGGVAVSASAGGYRGAIQEREPALASLSEARRRGVAEESGAALAPFVVKVDAKTRLAELRLALIPREWPPGAAEPEFADASPAPLLELPAPGVCRYYGVVFDLATKKPLRSLALSVPGAAPTSRTTTDGQGRYIIDVPRAIPGEPPKIAAKRDGYRAGFARDLEPSLLTVDSRLRKEYADEQSDAFEPIELPCELALTEMNLVAVPEPWPAAPPAETLALAALPARAAPTPVALLDPVEAGAVALVDPYQTDAPAGSPRALEVARAIGRLKAEAEKLLHLKQSRDALARALTRGGVVGIPTQGPLPNFAAPASSYSSSRRRTPLPTSNAAFGSNRPRK